MKKIIMLVTVMFMMSGCKYYDKLKDGIEGDISGGDRTAFLYDRNGNLMKTYKDEEMQYNTTRSGVSIWLGTKNKRVATNAIYIVEDN